MAAARMLNRTRPSARTFTAPLYHPTTGIFPTELYSMPLIFLASIEDLLTKRFINEKELTIKTLLPVPGGEPIADLTGKPRALALTRLLEALTLWHTELQNVSDIDVSPEMKTKLTNAPASLKKAMQFTASELLASSVRAIPGAPPSPSFVEVAFSGHTTVTDDIAATAEVLTTLARMSRTAMRSQFLEERVSALVNTFGTQTLAMAATKPSKNPTSDVFWTLALFNEWELHNPNPSAMPWFAETHKQLRAMVNQWDSVR
jgi:hypothetical protein